MSEYYWIIIWIAVYALLSNIIGVRKRETVCGKKVYRYGWMWAVLGVVPLVYLCAVRKYVGDTWSYTRAFKGMPF